MATRRSSLRDVLASGRFAVTTEIAPPRGANVEAVRRKAHELRDWVDAANVTDNQGAMVRMASWGASLIALAEGLEPVMQMVCRDRNRLALQSDLIAAGALGIPNVVLMGGDQPTVGDHPDAKAVFDLDSRKLLSTARMMRDEGKLLSGRELKPPPSWLIGAVEDPFAPGVVGAERLEAKVEAGAEFVQTQFVFEVAKFAAWIESVRAAGLDKRCAVLAGVGPIASLRTLERMGEIPGIHIPDALRRRLTSVPAERVPEESIEACIEVIHGLQEVPGVAGVHIMAVGMEDRVPEIIERAGLGRRAVAR